MAEQVGQDDCRTADHCSLLADDMGVNSKTVFPPPPHFSSSSSYSAAAPLQGFPRTTKDLAKQVAACQVDGGGRGDDTLCGCGNAGRDRQSRGGGGHSGVCGGHHSNRQQLQLRVMVAVVLSCAALMVTACCTVCVVLVLAGEGRGDSRMEAEVQDLKEEVQRLRAVCTSTARWPAPQQQQGPVLAAHTDFPASGFPWQHEATTRGRAPSVLFRVHGRVDAQNEEDGDNTAYNGYDDDDDDEEEEEEEGAHWSRSFLHGLSRPKRNAKNAKNAKKQTRNARHCKKVDKCIKAKEKGGNVPKRCKKVLRCLPPPQSSPVMKAVHFTSDFDTRKDKRQKKFGKEPCIYIEEWKSTVCSSNKTVRSHENISSTNDVDLTYAETPLHLNEGAPWMESLYKNDKSQQPIVPLNDGGFNITQSGLYLIYSSVMFHDVKPRQSQAVVVNGREKRFKCMDSVDYVGQGQQKYKTCTILAVTHMKANDRLEVQNLYAQTEIDQAKDATFFGAVLLSPVEIN
ncbi:uncharacterized protein LOC143289226 isoform X2 [Babylonia areolata]|uniref:uncharacterized protein LOC143289226 isoform X2 n=1 Tax=Babylonia areolata TaxID=304850 RepID=UPI003FD50001